MFHWGGGQRTPGPTIQPSRVIQRIGASGGLLDGATSPMHEDDCKGGESRVMNLDVALKSTSKSVAGDKMRAMESSSPTICFFLT